MTRLPICFAILDYGNADGAHSIVVSVGRLYVKNNVFGHMLILFFYFEESLTGSPPRLNHLSPPPHTQESGIY